MEMGVKNLEKSVDEGQKILILERGCDMGGQFFQGDQIILGENETLHNHITLLQKHLP